MEDNMSKGLKILLIVLVVLGVGGMAISYFTTPKSSYTEEAVEDSALVEELDTIAKNSLNDYFGIEVNENNPWEKILVLNRAKENTGLSNVYSLSVQDATEDKAEGSLRYYGIIVEETTTDLRGFIYDYISEAEVLALTEAQIQERTREFLVAQGFVGSASEMVFGEMKASGANNEFRMFTIETEGDAYYVGYNLQLDQVMYMEVVPGIVEASAE